MSKKMTMQEAITEAKRCLNCSRPLCRTGCPIKITYLNLFVLSVKAI